MVRPESRPPVWTFGAFELDPGARELRRSGLAVRIPPQALRVLIALLERPGQVVSRSELRQLLWGDRTFVSFDRSLNFCLSRLRRALRDDARHPRYVETVPGRGYRFIAPAHRTVASPPPAAAREEAPAKPSRLASAFAVAALLLLALAVSSRRVARDPEAQALYGRARALCGHAGWRQSIPLYRLAIARDPRFAAAHAGMAQSYLALGESGELDVAEAFAGAREAARRALALEERADAHLVLGRTALAHDWDFGHAEREIRRALVLEPSSVAAWVSLARLHSAKGDHDAAIQAARRAEALDPASPAAVEELAWCYYRARRPDEAARQFRRVGERRPEEAHHVLFAMFREAGRYQEALSQAQAVMQRAGVPEADRLRLRHLPPEAAATAFLRGTVAHLRREAGHHRVPPERLALLHAALGERAAAIGWLSRAADERSPGLVTALVDPALDRLRAEPEFVSLLGRVRARALGAS